MPVRYQPPNSFFGSSLLDAPGVRPEWALSLIVWALSEPRVRKVWAFGSRAKGGYRSDSDLNIAYELTEDVQGGGRAYAASMAAAWLSRLQEEISVPLDLQYVDPDQGIVWGAVSEHGAVICGPF